MRRGIFAVVVVLVAGSAAIANGNDVVVECNFLDSGDHHIRGFYVENYPANNLGEVTLSYAAIPAAGLYGITLTARSETYDGELIGQESIEMNIDEFPEFQLATYDFENAAAPQGGIVTFAQEIYQMPDGGRSVFYASVDSEDPGSLCIGVQATDGTTPPLSTDRSGAVGVIITAPEAKSEYLYGAALCVLVIMARVRRENGALAA